MPNTFAYVALLGWPLIAIFLFRALEVERAIIWSVVLSFLFLPAAMAIDIRGLPALDKVTISNITLLALILLTQRKRFRFLPESRVGMLLFVVLIASPFLTASYNPEPIRHGETVLPGMTVYDAFSRVADIILNIMIPVLIGRSFLSRPVSHKAILQVLCTSGLAYSILMLFEIRMSPQLHTWVYGYFPHSFLQQMRDGGFRPVVFMRHGLWVAFFAMTTAVAAAILWRSAKASAGPRAIGAARSAPGSYLLASGYMAAVLVLCKSLGSLIHACVALPAVLLATTRRQIQIATVLVLIAITYPALRSADLFPIDTIQEIAAVIDARRAASLHTRMVNEEELLEKARERPLFGWGMWGRNRIYGPDGRDLSITDGYWIITIGSWGWIGYIATLGLLAVPVLKVMGATRKSKTDPDPVTSGICLLVAINMVEILPNSTLPPWTWLMAGALLGYAEKRQVEESPATPNTRLHRPERRTVL